MKKNKTIELQPGEKITIVYKREKEIDSEYLSINQICTLLEVDRKTVYNWEKDEKLTAVYIGKAGKTKRFLKTDVEKLKK